MIAIFQSLVQLIEDAPEVAAVACQHDRMAQSIEIMLGFLLTIEIVHAVHVETTINVANDLAMLCQTSASLNNLLARYGELPTALLWS